MKITKSDAWFHAAAAALLAFMAIFAGSAVLRESAGIDEVAHIGAGVSYLQKLDLRLNEEHPPLSKVIAAAPLVLRGVHADYSSDAWKLSTNFFRAYGLQWMFGEFVLTHWNDRAATLAWARAPMLLLTLALGWLIYLYATRLAGPWSGLLCLALYATTPAFLTFGPLVLNDVAITLFSLWAIWELANLWKDPSRNRAIILGVALAGAMLTKFSAGILLLCIPAFALSARWLPFPGQPVAKDELRTWRRLRWRKVGYAVVVSCVLVYAVYFVLSWNQPTSALGLLGTSHWTEPFRRLLMPPWLYLRGLIMMAVMSSRPSFLLGHAYPHGVWFYYPIVVLLKSAVGFLALALLAALVALLRRRSAVRADSLLHWRALWVSFGVFTAIMMVSRMDISIRHFSIPLALMILFIAPLPLLLDRWWQRGIIAGLAASCLVTAIVAWPNYLPYVNALAFGHPVYELVNDSNVDWDQALPEVRKFADAHGLSDARIDFYGMSDPAAVVPGAELWDCQAPEPQDGGAWRFVSSNMILDTHNCGWLLRYKSVALGGGSMYAFQLPDPIPEPGKPGGPPPVSERRQWFDAPFDPRAVIIDMMRHPNEVARKMEEMEQRFQAQMQKTQAKAK